ncbi:MAG: VCBS repeat-containing protein [Chlorobi bacterium]|nr:VCBS repeat-containing protein [Chlorobiota bacterium]MCI0715824.1 VCBS repeat-containing protein [Chlorobiota bacterium]
MKKLFALFLLVFLANFNLKAITSNRTFSIDEVKILAGGYLSQITFENPVFVDVDNDGDFDALNFKKGNIEYYKNSGSLESPVFILENKHYDKYDEAFFVASKMPYPMFFADKDGDGDVDMFVVRDKEFDKASLKYEYNIGYAENSLNLDTGTLITIILVLVIVLLILAILGR